MRRRRSRPVPGSAAHARPPGRRIGLLGGSFNPAHEGHRHISLLALKRLGLHEVWWLVSPQNPLKPRTGMAAFDERLATARAAAGDARLRVSDIERRLGSCYSVDTVARLKRRFPRTGWSGSSAPTTCRRSRRGGAGPRSSGHYPLRSSTAGLTLAMPVWLSLRNDSHAKDWRNAERQGSRAASRPPGW